MKSRAINIITILSFIITFTSSCSKKSSEPILDAKKEAVASPDKESAESIEADELKKEQDRVAGPAEKLEAEPIDVNLQGAKEIKKLLNVEISGEGIVRLTHAQMMTYGVDLQGVAINKIGLQDIKGLAPVRVGGSVDGVTFDSSSYIEFVVNSPQSIYASGNVYTIFIDEFDTGVLSVNTMSKDIPEGRSQYFYQESVVFEKQNLYEMHAPGKDPWVTAELHRGSNGSDVNFSAKLKVDNLAENLFFLSHRMHYHIMSTGFKR